MRGASGEAVAEPLCQPSEFLHRATPLFSDALRKFEKRGWIAEVNAPD